LQRTATENKRLNYSIPTDDTTPLTNDTTPLTVDTAIRAKSALYAVKLDAGLQTIQRIKGTEKYANIYLILRVVTAILRMQARKIRELLTSTSI
jgi:hypothetical protein